ncbi:MAG: hypothetical protein RL514_4727 [Verrucomicrobiota bacterium]|jgi:inhibitor of KinA sporulation pathway (predicted exonuclease)
MNRHLSAGRDPEGLREMESRWENRGLRRFLSPIMNPMHAIIVDLEATCCDAGSIPSHAMEIIEIGAVAVCAVDGAPLAEFQSFVRPVRHPQFTPFCTQLISIQQADVDGAPTFLEVVARLRAWLTPLSPNSWCSWGDYDRKQFVQDCAFHRVGFPFAGPHRNLKTEFVAARVRPKKLGMSEALHALGLTFEDTVHRGIDDARNIARISLKAFGTYQEARVRKAVVNFPGGNGATQEPQAQNRMNRSPKMPPVPSAVFTRFLPGRTENAGCCQQLHPDVFRKTLNTTAVFRDSFRAHLTTDAPSGIIVGKDRAFRRRTGCASGSSESCGSPGRRI